MTAARAAEAVRFMGFSPKRFAPRRPYHRSVVGKYEAEPSEVTPVFEQNFDRSCGAGSGRERGGVTIGDSRANRGRRDGDRDPFEGADAARAGGGRRGRSRP